MAERPVISATPRERAGKGAARAIRREGRVPAVIYGGKKAPENITIETRALLKEYNTGLFLRTLYDVDLEGKKSRVIPRDVQLHPVTDMPVHVDLLRLEKGARISVEVVVNFTNEEACPGLVKGGVLNIVRHDVELTVPVDEIPTEIVVDLTGLDFGASVHISSIPLPDGCTPTITDRDFTIATIAAPAGGAGDEEAEGDEGEEAATEDEAAAEEGGE
ncbi:MAG: 50S ribosomal protein L25/general stress protein Ctc [Alphaproteobacteria bacterium]|nr:MAG: 50S ribosomal protein L25/general stress protein Ctc [Alphaproteobacteria bacterium]